MKLNLDENYFIETYLSGYALYDIRAERVRTSKEGKTYRDRDAIGYYGTIPQALERYLRIKTDEKDVYASVKEYVEQYREHYEEVINLLPKVKGETHERNTKR